MAVLRAKRRMLMCVPAEATIAEDDADARAIGEAAVEEGPVVGQRLADELGDVVGGGLNVGFRGELGGRKDDLAGLFDVDPVVAVDHDFVDFRVAQQGDQGARKNSREASKAAWVPVPARMSGGAVEVTPGASA